MNAALKIENYVEETELNNKNIIKTNLNLAQAKQILIVEDDQVLRTMLENYAKKFYTKIYTFSNAEAATFFINNTELLFDTVLLDYFLPGKNAMSLMDYIKTKEDGKIYLMSGQLDQIDLTKKSKNFANFLEKPLSIQTINQIFK